MMGSTCEIVESKDETELTQNSKGTQYPRAYEREWKPPMGKLGPGNSIEDDISKLFEAINLKNASNSKDVGLSDQSGTGPSRKNALKKPIRVGMSHTPGIGFSEPVSLKQALRGLCISQASEMAAMRRLSKSSASPRISEAGKITSLYRSVVVEAGDSSTSMDDGKGRRLEISLLPEESTSASSEKESQDFQMPKVNSSSHSIQSSPQFAMVTLEKRTGPTPVNDEIISSLEVQSQTLKEQLARENECQTLKEQLAQEDEHTAVPSQSHHVSGDNILETDENIPSMGRDNKVSPTKLRRKGRLQTISPGATKINKVGKSTRTAQRLVKPIIRNKPILRKNLMQDLVSAASASNGNSEISHELGSSTSQLVCERCHCSMTIARKESGNDSPASNCEGFNAGISPSTVNPGVNKPGFTSSNSNLSGSVVLKANQSSKPIEKGDISQSSKSSRGEYSSSTSVSDDSNLSGSSFGSRPHMSKDLKWEAIRQVKKQLGTLGLRHFNLLQKLGFGDIGTVYLAELIGTNCLFALKVMDNEYLDRRKKLSRAQTEKEILGTLDHPFLPTLYSQFTSDNLSCLVMEYCPGGDLHVLRQKQPGRYFSEQAARFYVAEVLLALEYLHMLGVIYRDLKPENILVREDGHIMLTDFDLSLRCNVNPTLLKSSSAVMEPPRMSGPCTGSSCIDPFCIEPSCQVSCFSPRIFPASAKARKLKADLADRARSLPQLVAEPTEARSNSFVGTHEYLAPEIIKGEGHGSAVDWWTFGVFLYELLYGKTPFKGSGNEETLANVVYQSLKFPDSPIVSCQARDLIRNLLVKEPENRLGSVKGAAEIKQHPFFDGLNWALIRCAIPPQLPELCDVGDLVVATQEKGRKYLEYRATGEHLEFELF